MTQPSAPVSAIPPRTLLKLSAVVWLSLWLAQCVQTYIYAHAAGRPWSLIGTITISMPWWISWFVLTPVVAWIASRWHFVGDRFWRPLGAHVVACLAVSSVQLTATGSVYWLTAGRTAGVASSMANQVQRFFGNFFLESVLTYGGVAGVLVAIDFARAMRDKEVSRARLEKQAVALEASLAKARLDALRMELNPHFLFNTLTAISGLVAQDRKGEAREVIGRLGELLRRALEGGHEQFSTVDRELEVLQDYLYIQRLRFADRMSVQLDVDDNARTCMLPSLLLLQLVENAIRHGIEPLEGRGTVMIQIDRVAASVRIAIADTGAGFVFRGDQELVREGIGISNTRARLEHVYGDRAALHLQNRTQGGAEAIIVIPDSLETASPLVAAQASPLVAAQAAV